MKSSSSAPSPDQKEDTTSFQNQNDGYANENEYGCEYDREELQERRSLLSSSTKQRKIHNRHHRQSETKNNWSIPYDLKELTGSTARNKTLTTITSHSHAGTPYSRSGKYVRPTWSDYFANNPVMKWNILSFFSIMFGMMLLGLKQMSPVFDSVLDDYRDDGGTNVPNHFYSHAGSDGKNSSMSSPEKILNDYTSTTTMYDSHLSKVHYWCVTGNGKQNRRRRIHGNREAMISEKHRNRYRPKNNGIDNGEDDCLKTCKNPLQPLKKDMDEDWARARKINLELVMNVTALSAPPGHDNDDELDIVLLGDSITEFWNGRESGVKLKELNDINEIYQRLFQKSKIQFQETKKYSEGNIKYDDEDEDEMNNNLNGLALGIAGETIPGLLYRMQNGEIPRNLNPKVWWLLIGTNDLGSSHCSAEVILIGIIRLVEEIRQRKPNAIVVINGILPRTRWKDGSLTWKDGSIQTDTDASITSTSSGGSSDPNSSSASSSEHASSSSFVYSGISGIATVAATENVTIPDDINDKGGEIQPQIEEKQKQALPSLFDYWPSIQAVNSELQKFAEKHSHVEYYDASDLFLTQLGNSHFQRDEKILVQELMGDFLHPSAMGYKIWGDAIVEYTKSLIDDDVTEGLY